MIRLSRKHDEYLRSWYGPQVKVSPAILAYDLGLGGTDEAIDMVLDRLATLGLRSRRESDE
jgi:hypothetical protein